MTPSSREARSIERIDQLQMRDVMTIVGRTVRGTRGGDRIEPDAHRAIADRVHVHLNAALVELGDHRVPALPATSSDSPLKPG